MVDVIDIEKIKPAPYNPRRIKDEQIEKLKESFRKIGFVVPVLVNRKNNVIIAGHQRTKTAKKIGITKVPVQYVDEIDVGDEIKFNQMHNAIDYRGKEVTRLLNDHYEKEKFIEIDNSEFTTIKTSAVHTKEICNLTIKYGNVLSCVVCKGKVLLGNEYVKACKLLGLSVNTYICDDSKYDDIVYYFGLDYGEYFYDDIKKDTYVQGLAQMFRSVEKVGDKKQNESQLYTKMVLPYLAETKCNDILDFGCGKGAYINSLKKSMDAVGVEFYNNNGSQINITKGNKQIDDLIEHLKKKKHFDVVVCDSVLNSVDCMEAESAVLTCLNLFAEETVFISGRTTKDADVSTYVKRDGSARKNWMKYLDGNNFTANYRKGKWFFQHFHEKDGFHEEVKKFGFEIVQETWGNTFRVQMRKVRDLTDEEYRKAIDYEFNLPLPFGKRYGRHEDVKKALNL